MINENTIEKVKESVKIVEIVSDFIKIKKQGSNYVANCPFHNEKSPSFVINPTDNFCKCFGCGKGLDSIGFIMEFKKWNYQQSIEYIANKYKIPMELSNEPKKAYTKPVFKNNTSLSDKLVKWFLSERKINQTTLEKLKITEEKTFIPQVQGERNCIRFNYFRNEELINVKSRDSQKNFKLESGAELILYNLDSLKNAKECYWVEGEIDCATLVECGIMRDGVAVISVPNGASKDKNNLKYIDNCINDLKHVEIHYLGFDNDLNGRKLREDIAERLGKEICKYIEWKDCKDANEVLVKYGIQGVIECCGDKKEFPIVGVFNVSDYSDAIDDMYTNGIERGVGIGFKKFDEHLRFVRGWITVITGQPSSGKSDFTDQIALGLMINHQWKFAFYSPENDPFQLHFSKLARKLIGKSWYGANKINQLEKNLVKSFLEDKLFIIKPKQDFSLDSILESVRLLQQQKGIDCFVIDAWNRLEHKYSGANEAKYVQESLTKLDSFCRNRNIHCFLIAHPTKLEPDKRTGEYPVVRMYNISGGAHFRNIAANGISVHRDFKNGITEIYIQKVKFIPYWGQMGKIDLKYDVESGRFNEYNIEPGFVYNEDKTNWILKNQVQTTLPEYDGGIILNAEDPPF
jgi:twinkle protein